MDREQHVILPCTVKYMFAKVIIVKKQKVTQVGLDGFEQIGTVLMVLGWSFLSVISDLLFGLQVHA